MIKPGRILIIIRKEFIWLFANKKILVNYVLLPFLILFSVVFMPLEETERRISIAILFPITYFGVFFSSFLIIREKEKRTLLALLITPLQGVEWVLGVFLTGLIMSLSFCLTGGILLSRFDVFFELFTVLNIILLAGTLCFIGMISGLFSESQKESGQYNFLIYLLFLGGAFFSFSSYDPWLPDYHLTQLLIKDESLSFLEKTYHTAFNFIFFFNELESCQSILSFLFCQQP